MRVVEIRATPGPPLVTYRYDPICGMVEGGPCQELATIGVYHRSTGGRSTELIYWCPKHAALFDDSEEGSVPSNFSGWFKTFEGFKPR